jgi:hypothetical protein
MMMQDPQSLKNCCLTTFPKVLLQLRRQKTGGLAFNAKTLTDWYPLALILKTQPGSEKDFFKMLHTNEIDKMDSVWVKSFIWFIKDSVKVDTINLKIYPGDQITQVFQDTDKYYWEQYRDPGFVKGNYYFFLDALIFFGVSVYRAQKFLK